MKIDKTTCQKGNFEHGKAELYEKGKRKDDPPCAIQETFAAAIEN